ncbi:hypothetical protein [Paenibacillus sp. RUD330]|uniref:hypothetical protein n=1 Tax=Paenibacillus sp. RUD330 TaxID=2023772 RepID=UPI000B92636A|nr:hypothetical protein [Paenibacillus sp. RUD330]ASS66218.1 hypothetical protein CIC07_08700 [Paenibacillus sp. RUD330]
MEEIRSANHSAEPVIQETSHTPAAEAPVTTQETPATPEGIRVKYNKEERVIGLDEAPTWIQKGLNYDKLQEKVGTYEQHSKQLERAAKYYGFSDVDSYVQALDEDERNRQIAEEAERLGVDESVIMEHLQPLRQKVDELSAKDQELTRLKTEMELTKQLTDIRAKYPDFDQYSEKVVEFYNQGYQLEHAYILASHEDKVSKIAKETESNTIRNLQQNAATSTGALGAESPEEKTGYLSMSPAERKAFREQFIRGR